MKYQVLFASFIVHGLLSTIAVADQVRVQVFIQAETEVGRYNDAIYYPVDAFPGLESKAVQDARKARVDAYVETIRTQSSIPAPEPTKEDLQKQALEKQSEIDRLIVEKADLEQRASKK